MWLEYSISLRLTKLLTVFMTIYVLLAVYILCTVLFHTGELEALGPALGSYIGL